MQNLKVKLIETDLYWEDAKSNLEQFEKYITNQTENIDLFILPEMFTSGFTMNPDQFLKNNPENALKWMQKIATTKVCAITGSFVFEEKGFRNRMYFVFPDGSYEFYDKRHLFSFAGEDKKYSAGKERKIVSYKGWKILLQVCYDLRFPVFSRNTLTKEGPSYDAIIYVANWPSIRINAWDTLLKGRAIENLAYSIGVNRKGKDQNGIEYTGHSACYDPVGLNVELNNHNIELSKQVLLEYRNKFKFLEDQDKFNVKYVW